MIKLVDALLHHNMLCFPYAIYMCLEIKVSDLYKALHCYYICSSHMTTLCLPNAKLFTPEAVLQHTVRSHFSDVSYMGTKTHCRRPSGGMLFHLLAYSSRLPV